MFCAEECEIIRADVCDISDRLKEIDNSYVLVRNRKEHRFELHDGGNADSLLCVLPFDRLDERTVIFVRQTRRERLERLIEELDKENERRSK